MVDVIGKIALVPGLYTFTFRFPANMLMKPKIAINDNNFLFKHLLASDIESYLVTILPFKSNIKHFLQLTSHPPFLVSVVKLYKF